MSSVAEDIWTLGNEWHKDGNYPRAITRNFCSEEKK